MPLPTFSVLFLALSAGSASAVDWTSPHLEPQDSLAAFAESDEYAWRLFVALMGPQTLRLVPRILRKHWEPTVLQPGKPGEMRERCFDGRGYPGPWLGPAPFVTLAPTDRFEDLPLQQQMRLQQLTERGLAPAFDLPAAQRQRNETRLNEHLRIHQKHGTLQSRWSVEGVR